MNKIILVLIGFIGYNFKSNIALGEIPFNQAQGVYQNTRSEYKDISPFWGMVALHGKLLERIRFFGHYTTGTNKSNKPVDLAEDPIAQLILWLFPSPDGVQLVANTNNQDPVGNLSRNLGKINTLIEILETDAEDEKKIQSIVALLKPLDKNTKAKINLAFAELVVQAYNTEKTLANPDQIHQQLYPKNIVIIALLSFFCKVADDAHELKKLPLLMGEDFSLPAVFNTDDYFLLRNQGEQALDIIVNETPLNPELLFLMAKGYDNYENIYLEPIQYRSDTNFIINKKFADCGETSLRNILMGLLGESGHIPEDSFKNLQEKITPLFKIDLNDPKIPFQKMVSFFRNHPHLAEAATKATHDDWAAVVSDLNQDQLDNNLQTIQYGQGSKDQPNTYEIKSNISKAGVNGIINMLNVIAKIIPDQELNEPWSEDEFLRLKQAAQKLTRFCELLSRNNHIVSWKIANSSHQNLNSPFETIALFINDKPIYYWIFIPGHFQVSRIILPNHDWREKYAHATTFPNDWLAAFFVRLDEADFLQDHAHNIPYLLAQFYNPQISSLDGALKNISIVLYEALMGEQNLNQFLSLIARWIDKSIPLNDHYALEKLSFLLSTVSDKIDLAQILSLSQYQIIDAQRPIWDKAPTHALINKALHYRLNTELIMLAHKLGKETEVRLNLAHNSYVTDFVLAKINQHTHLVSLNLDNNSVITDAAVSQLSNLTMLNLSYNKQITQASLKRLTNLHILNLSRNNLITDRTLGTLTHLITLNLSYNKKITNNGLANLQRLINLNLADNEMITDEGLGQLCNLKSLDLTHNHMIHDNCLKKLKNLMELNLSYNSTITDKGIERLSNLKHLNLSHNSRITDKGLRKLTNLTELILSFNLSITDTGLKKLTKLKTLDVTNNQRITQKFIEKRPLINIKQGA